MLFFEIQLYPIAHASGQASSKAVNLTGKEGGKGPSHTYHAKAVSRRGTRSCPQNTESIAVDEELDGPYLPSSKVRYSKHERKAMMIANEHPPSLVIGVVVEREKKINDTRSLLFKNPARIGRR